MKHCPSVECPHRRRHRIALEYQGDVETCGECGTALVDGVAPEPQEAELAASASILWSRRLAVSVACVVAAIAGTHVLLPGVEPELADAIGRHGSTENISVLALGIAPYLSATVMVELAALLVPRWRELRRSSPQGRYKLFRAALILTPMLAFFQGFGIAMYVEGLGMSSDAGWGPRLFTSLTLTAGAVIMLGLAGFAHQFGAGNGVSVLIAGSALPSLWQLLRSGARAVESEALTPLGALSGLAVLAIPVYATWRFAQLQSSPARMEAPGHLVRLPSSGIVPLAAAASLLALPATLANLGVPGMAYLIVHPASTTRLFVEVALVVGLCVVFTLLFHLPANVARVAGYPAPREHIARAAAATAVYLIILLVASHLGTQLLPGAGTLDATSIAVLSAVALDVHAELRARRASAELVLVRPIDQVYAAQVATLALRKAGIAHHARGLYHRTLLQFYGPYVAIELFVRPQDAARAIELVESALVPGARRSDAR